VSRLPLWPLALLCLAGVQPVEAAEPSPRALRAAIDAVVARADLSSASWGIEVRSLDSGRLLYARDAERALRPASTLKLVTTAAALDVFGPGARFRTTVETAGRLDAMGRILGDVHLVGHGDPSLSTRFGPEVPGEALSELAGALAAAGVHRIEGRLIGNEAEFSGDRRGHDWTWEDLVWGYGTEISALSWHDNVLDLSLRPGERPGAPALLERTPPSSRVPVTSTVVTAEAGGALEIRLDRQPGVTVLSGHLPLGQERRGRLAVEDPARFAADAFAEALAVRGIRIAGGVASSRSALPGPQRVLAERRGAALAEIVRVTNKESHNLYAEMLLRSLGVRLAGEGSVERGRQAALEVLARLGVPTRGFALTDGSGLARTDLATARGLVALLAAMDRHRDAAVFRDSLATAGVDGTLERRLRGTPAEGRIAAKTGSFSGVSALAGYARTARRGRLAFAVLLNNYEVDPAQAQAAADEIARALVSR
jgi:D-alanyl-D-alanine carboxypeptidase/D-alanyl-D-alanine-endopeptidase (penicillin-binding protein 4)